MTPFQPLLANDYTTVYSSPDPENLYAYSPGLALLPSGRLIATIDLGGPGVKGLQGVKGRGEGSIWQGKVYTSDDKGETWTHRTDYPFLHARPFVAGKSVYVLGQAEDLTIIRSDDGGETWGAPVTLSQGERWHQAPCNVHYAHGCVYLVMEKTFFAEYPIMGWPVGNVAPILMRGRIGDDLTVRENWTFASALVFEEAADQEKMDGFGVPFFAVGKRESAFPAPNRDMAPIGWLETNVVQFNNPDHIWCDSTGKTFHLWMRAHTGGVGYACIAKVVEQGEQPGTGEMVTSLEKAPSGKTMLYVPCPGGQMKFHVLYDEPSKLYWLLSTQATDSMVRPDRLPPNRYNLPNNERRRLQLHYSKNMVDWCFAGMVAIGPVEQGSRHYASMVIDGDDLYVLSRSGDERAKTPHNGNLITFHRVRDFRRTCIV